MKKVFYSIVLILLGFYPLFAQQSYYYCQGKRVFLPENEFVRYVRLKNTLSESQIKIIQEELSSCCSKVYEYNPFLSKYFILEDKIEQFNDVISSNDTSVCLNSSNCASNDTLTFYPSRTILVKVKPSTSLMPVLDSIGVPYINIVQSRYNAQEYIISLSSDVALRCAALLYETGLFEYAQPDFYESDILNGYEDNPEYQYQWAVHNDINMNLLPAWNITTGHPQIKVAVLDNGVDLNHSDLINNLLEGYDAVDDSNHPSSVCCGEFESDFDFHGTLCTGVIVAANNEEGLVGVAHTSKVVPIRINHTVVEYFKDVGPGNPTYHLVLVGEISWKIDAFNHACYEDKADIINCSFTTADFNDVIRNKITEISQNGRGGKGCVVVISSGNQEHTFPNPSNDLMGPFASHPCVIAVGGINECGERMKYGHYCNIDSGYNSCYGDSLDVVAPGIHVPTTNINGGYTRAFGGTSAAAPHVAGVAALVLSVNPCLTREEVKYVIESTCTKIRPDLYVYGNDPNHPNGTWNIEVGYGLVNAYAAVQLAQQLGGYTYIKDSIITGNIVWTGNKMIHDSLVIDSLATLTIMDTVYMSASARLIVRPGGKLVVDGGTLTSACDGEMWQGIEVVGDRTKSQTAANQGTVELRNGAVIENAWCGIRTGLREDTLAFASTGGIITADSSTFRNNRQSVAINSYAYTLPSGSVENYSALFNHCTFTIDTANLFAANNTAFAEHVRLWDVKGVKFRGCVFRNNAANFPSNGRGIYAHNAGLKLDVSCADDGVQLSGYCGCPPALSDSCEFSGFTTAVEVVTSGNPYAVEADRVRFSNNSACMRINANNFVTVTRCDFNLQTAPYSLGNIGLWIDNCTGYKVEGNTFNKVTYSSYPFSSTGILVSNSGGSGNNLLYLNSFSNLNYGIRAEGNNGGNKYGLQFTCNDFSWCGIDFYVAQNATVASSIGSSLVGADNVFQNTRTSSLYNAGSQSIGYYYSLGSNHAPYNPVNITTVSVKYANSCASTLCNNEPIKSLAGFQSDMNAYTTALAAAANTEEMENGDSAEVKTQNFASLQQALSETYYDAVRAIMADSVLDLNALEQWHTAAQPIADPYSLTETRFCEGYAETFAENAENAENAEMANYAEFHAMKLALRNNDDDDVGANNDSPLQPGNHINWYALTPAQIAQLQTIAERNTGRASVMAKGVLCFFFGICYENDLSADDNADNAETRSAKAARQDGETNLSVYPNPADDLLYIELSGAEITRIALYDLQGRVVGANNSSLHGTTATMNLRHVPAGVYVLRVTDADGKEYRRKIVRK